MSDTTTSIARKLESAGELHVVVRTMKSIAASRVVQYQDAVRALADYHRSVGLALSAYLREQRLDGLVLPDSADGGAGRGAPPVVRAVVFGSDQGLVGQFNQRLAQFAVKKLSAMPGRTEVWAGGERVNERLAAEGLVVAGQFPVPTSVNAIVPLVAGIQVETGMHLAGQDSSSFFLFYHHPLSESGFEPVCQQLLPLDLRWQQEFADIAWPERRWPEVVPAEPETLRALIGELLFISIFRGCAESLASENASRLASMTRAERNIDEMSKTLRATYHQLRQAGIDEELFDLVAGYDALIFEKPGSGRNPRDGRTS